MSETYARGDEVIIICPSSVARQPTPVSQVKVSQVLSRTSALLCLSLAIASSFPLRPGTAFPLVLAQATTDAAARTCATERQQSTDNSVNADIERAEQALSSSEVDQASRLLVTAFQRLKAMPDSPAKVAVLERLVGSFGENVAHTSSLERLIQAVPSERPQAALAVLAAAFETTRTVSSSHSASKARTFTVIANGYARLGQPEQSNRILAEALTASNTIQGAEFQTISLTGIAEAYLNAEQPNLAAPILERSLQLAQTINNPNPYSKIGSLERIASLYAKIGQPDRALQIVRSIQEPNYRSGVISVIVNQYAEMGQLDRALEVVQTIQQAEPKAANLAAIAGRLTAQQPQRAAKLYAEAVSIARSMGDANQLLAYIAQRYVETGGLVATADQTIQAIADPLVQAPALGSIALFQAKAGQENLAEARLTEAITTLERISDPTGRSNVTRQLIDQAVQLGRYDYALKVAATIQAGEETPFDRVDMLTRIADQAIVAKRYDAALQITEQIPPSFVSWRDRLFLQIARGLTQTGELDQALAIAEQENLDPSFRPRILAVIAAQVQKLGQTERATQLFGQATQLTNQIDDPVAKTETLGAIAEAYLSAEQREPATQSLKQAIAAAQAIRDPLNRSYTLRRVVEQLTLNNYYQAAIQVVEAIPEDSERLPKLNEVIEKATNAGDFTTSLAVLGRLEDPVVKSRWLITLADRSMVAGEQTQAVDLLNQAVQTVRTIPGDESKMVTVRGGENPLIVEDDQDRGSFLAAIALKYAQLNQLSQAQKVAQTLENATTRQQLLQQLDCYR